ncbi:rhamnogalacturonan lyase [Halalkalibaculum sp. DA384]|uniref:rhamnogalacturonan lyase n=1 Tax=Halalkalibaculum sp. DA384 TaxID=3373606 RepID=UPI003753F856
MAISAHGGQAQRVMEKIDRGVVAIPDGDDSAFISWRLLATDFFDTKFNVYRKSDGRPPVKLNESPLAEGTNFVDERVPAGASDITYFVKPVVDGREGETSGSYTLNPDKPYISVPVNVPRGYTSNDASAGDLDGDGQYEIVVHQTGRAHDNSHSGFTDEPILDAYELDGTHLWRINLGKNIREGAHYTQFMVYDLDSDGKAEVACKTADGTVDGAGKVIGDPDADHRNEDGYILEGPEFLTIFNGETGAELVTTDYIPPRHPDTLTPTSEQLEELWGDGYGNRVDRFLAGVAYLDGERPSLVMARGYYTRSVIVAWNWRDQKLTRQWIFDTNEGYPDYAGQGNHSLSVGDVDADQKDEIIYGSAVIDHDGTGLHSTGIGHGDALHYGDLDPINPGHEIFHIQERFDDAGANFREAESGRILWKKPSVTASDEGEGPGRGLAANIDPRYPGTEMWVRGGGIEGLFNARGEKISEQKPASCNFAVWWDGDLQRELLNRNRITKWNWRAEATELIFEAEGATSNNGTKATPTLSADLFGDWREEVIWRAEEGDELRIYTTAIPTEHRFYTLMHDPTYRLSIAWQNVAYNQPPHTSFYIGEDMRQRNIPPEIELAD